MKGEIIYCHTDSFCSVLHNIVFFLFHFELSFIVILSISVSVCCSVVITEASPSVCYLKSSRVSSLGLLDSLSSARLSLVSLHAEQRFQIYSTTVHVFIVNVIQ